MFVPSSKLRHSQDKNLAPVTCKVGRGIESLKQFFFFFYSGGISLMNRLLSTVLVKLTIRPAARKGYWSIAHEAKPNGPLTRGP